MASFESDSGEQGSTTDDIESSHQWTTDFEEDDSEIESEKNENVRTNSNDSDCDSNHPHRYVSSLMRCNSLQNDRKKCNKSNGKRSNLNGHFEKPQVQSDTETRNLLDDIGDFDDDYLDLQDASFNIEQQQQFSFNTLTFDLTSEQYDYYTKCFLYLLEKTQGHAQINGALNGADSQVIQFFKKSFLDNLVLSNIWALADVNEDGFLNLSEFIIAMHLIILHLKADVSIPARLPSSVRPPLTPTRQLVRLSNDCYATFSILNQPEELCSTTTSSASNSSSLKTNVTNANDDISRNSNISQQNQHTSFTSQLFSISQNNCIYSINNSNLSSGLPNKTINDSKPIIIDDGSTNKEEWTSSGVKQHSLSDDHLHLYAHRELTIAKFSDVPPVLVDSHPTALNAARLSMTSARGPPPKPPIRDYVLNSKGHGRSASLDLKTFSEILPNSPKSPRLNYCSSMQEHTQTLFNQQKLETLSEDWNQINFSQQKTVDLEKSKLHLKEKATQTETDLNLKNSALFEGEETFLTDDAYTKMSSEERCKYLKLVNGELENERVKLAQVRLQLQLRIEETEKKLQSVSEKSLKNVYNLTTINSVASKPTTL